jgi:hypothetical protein
MVFNPSHALTDLTGDLEMSKETGGRAFPWCGDLNETPTINLGMTLRDYFAAKVIIHALNSPHFVNHYDASLMAYEIADAMIRARGAA